MLLPAIHRTPSIDGNIDLDVGQHAVSNGSTISLTSVFLCCHFTVNLHHRALDQGNMIFSTQSCG